MKKLAIAASSVALAAMPIVGVFADVTTQTDDIEITIDKVCSIGYTDSLDTHVVDVEGVDHDDSTGTWALEGSTTPANPDAQPAVPADPLHDTLSATMSTGTSTNNLGTTTLGIYCNHEGGYTITTSNVGTMNGTYGGSAITDTIPVLNTFSDSASGWSYKVVAKSGSGWTQRGVVTAAHDNTWATSSNANEVIAQSPSQAPKTTLNTGDFFTITYGVGIDQTQSAGTYTGTVTYTLAQAN